MHALWDRFFGAQWNKNSRIRTHQKRTFVNCRKLGLPIRCNGSLCLVDGPYRTVSWRRYRVDCAMQLHTRWPEFVNGTSRRWNCPDRMHSTYGENARKSNPHLRSHHPKLIDSIPSVGRGSHLPSKEEDRIQTFMIQTHSLHVACF